MEKIKAVIADVITACRILFSLCLFVLSPSSALFAILYLLCGATDAMDGFAARKLHTESRFGELFDSLADMFFAAVYAIKILPLLCLPFWIWIWIAWIATVKTAGIIKRSIKERKVWPEHSVANKLTGLLIFFLPLTGCLIDIKYGAIIVCTAATFAAAENLIHAQTGTNS